MGNNDLFGEKRQKSGASIGRNSTRHTVKREIYESTEWENCAVAGYQPEALGLETCVFPAPLSLTIVYHKKAEKQWTGYIKYTKRNWLLYIKLNNCLCIADNVLVVYSSKCIRQMSVVFCRKL